MKIQTQKFVTSIELYLESKNRQQHNIKTHQI
jgi:hypothetical protein